MDSAARAWFDRRTVHHDDFDVPALVARKGATRVSVVLPALDEEATVGTVVAGVVELAGRTGLVDEVVVLDSGSTDGTAAVAAAAGARVHRCADVLPALGSRPGKGEALWKSLAVTSGDIVVFVDSDLVDFDWHFVTGLLGPLLFEPSVHLVKAFYDRPLLDVAAAGGGRVTELCARPLLNALFPLLAGVVQPLAGEYAARRTLLERLPFAAGYGVETGLLIDTVRTFGLDAIAQVDLGQRTHGHQDTAALGRMAASILRTVLSRTAPELVLARGFTQFRREGGVMVAAEFDVTVDDRPPMNTVREYGQG